MEKEIRLFNSFELRNDASNNRLVGYAAVFNSESRDLGGFVEIVKPGAFTKALKSGYDFKAFLNHSPDRTLGRVANKTLILSEDARGLKVEILLPNSQFGKDIAEEVRAGYLDQMSFGFSVVKESSTFKDGKLTRFIEEAELYEVSLVSEPAYLDTTVAKRSLDKFLKQKRYNPIFEKEIELYKLQAPKGEKNSK